MHPAQVMTATEGEVDPGCEIINTAEDGSNICKVDKSNNRFVIDFSSGINDIIRLTFMAMGKVKGKTVTEPVSETTEYPGNDADPDSHNQERQNRMLERQHEVVPDAV